MANQWRRVDDLIPSLALGMYLGVFVISQMYPFLPEIQVSLVVAAATFFVFGTGFLRLWLITRKGVTTAYPQRVDRRGFVEHLASHLREHSFDARVTRERLANVGLFGRGQFLTVGGSRVIVHFFMTDHVGVDLSPDDGRIREAVDAFMASDALDSPRASAEGWRPPVLPKVMAVVWVAVIVGFALMLALMRPVTLPKFAIVAYALLTPLVIVLVTRSMWRDFWHSQRLSIFGAHKGLMGAIEGAMREAELMEGRRGGRTREGFPPREVLHVKGGVTVALVGPVGFQVIYVGPDRKDTRGQVERVKGVVDGVLDRLRQEENTTAGGRA